ncbi:RAP domain-containing protein [Besnoitia besnoiti]|uniref:RAP domain-containing protein n=1 Tax=Besnoitia besnoiti TaxID=94643 RepID=A0A2A9MNB9_BESBE|nr:RAP domain-containing protein [Besnoitia besnoiti]PFH37170.1 RAP domain-containing protein [Besnoitia besnoiti]
MYSAAARPRRKVVVIPMEEKKDHSSSPVMSAEDSEKRITLPRESALRQLSKPEVVSLHRSLRFLPASVPRDGDYCDALVARTVRLCPSLLPIEIRSIGRTLVFALPASYLRALPVSAASGDFAGAANQPQGGAGDGGPEGLKAATLPQRRRRRGASYEALCVSPAQRELLADVLRHLSKAFVDLHLPLKKRKTPDLPAAPCAADASASEPSAGGEGEPSLQAGTVSASGPRSAVAQGEATSREIREVAVCLSDFHFLFQTQRDAGVLEALFKRLGDYLTLHGLHTLNGKTASLVLNAFVLCNQRHDHLFQQIAQRLPRLAPDMQPKDLALTANALARADVRFLPGFTALASRAKATLDAFGPQDFSNFLNAFGKLEILDVELFNQAAPKISASIRFYNPQHLSNVAHAYSKVSVQNPELFDRVAEMTRRSIQNFSNKELANLALAFAKQDVRHKGLLVSLADEVLFRGTAGLAFGSKFHFDLISLQQLSAAFARLGLHDPRLFFVLTRLAKDGVRKALLYRQFPGDASENADATASASASASASGSAVVVKKAPHMSAKWRREYEALRASFALNGQVFASLLLALGKAASSQNAVTCDQSLNAVFASAILRLERNFSAFALSQIARGCYLVGIRDGRVRQLLVREALPRLAQFPPSALVYLLSSFANLQLYCAGLFRQALQVCRLHLASYNAREVASLVIALEKLGYRQKAFLLKAAKVLHKKRYDLSPSFLCGAVNAFAKLALDDALLYADLFKDIFEKQHLLSPSEALSALYAVLLVDSRRADLAALQGGQTLARRDREELEEPEIQEGELEAAEREEAAEEGQRRLAPRARNAGAPAENAAASAPQDFASRETASSGACESAPTEASGVAEGSPSALVGRGEASVAGSFLGAQPSLVESLLRVAYRAQTNLQAGCVTRLQIADLYMRLLRPETYEALPFDLKAFLARVRAVDLAQTDCFALSSKMHRDVSAAFLRVGLLHRSEVQLGPFCLDIVLGERLAVEVDGPSHFYRETCMRVASSRLKQKLLREIGWTLLPISFFEWRQLVTPERKLAYCAQFWRPVLAQMERTCRAQATPETATETGVRLREIVAAAGAAGARDQMGSVACRKPSLSDFLWLMEQQGATVTRAHLAEAMKRFQQRLLAPTAAARASCALAMWDAEAASIKLLSSPAAAASGANLLPPSDAQDEKEFWRTMKGRLATKLPRAGGRPGRGGATTTGRAPTAGAGAETGERALLHAKRRGERRFREDDTTVFHFLKEPQGGGPAQGAPREPGAEGDDRDVPHNPRAVTRVVKPSSLNRLLSSTDSS